MTNLIAKVAELRKLEAKAKCCSPDDYDQGAYCKYSDDLRNAAPKLLAVAGQFRAGDARTLDVIATFFEIPREGMTAESYVKWLEWAACLRRMCAAAEIMEGNP